MSPRYRLPAGRYWFCIFLDIVYWTFLNFLLFVIPLFLHLISYFSSHNSYFLTPNSTFQPSHELSILSLKYSMSSKNHTHHNIQFQKDSNQVAAVSWKQWWCQPLVQLFLFIFSAICISFLLYGSGLPNDFVYDDELFSNRQDLRSPEIFLSVWAQPYIPGNVNIATWRPITILSFAINYIFFGPTAFSFRITSIILHALVAVLVGFVAYELYKSKIFAVSATFCFLIFPIHAEAVNWNKARDELLCALFVLVGMLALLRLQRVPYTRQALIAHCAAISVSFLLALLSKETAVAFIPIFIALFFVGRIRRSWGNFVCFCAALGVFGVYGVGRYAVLGEQIMGISNDWTFNPLMLPHSVSTRVWTAFAIFATYVQQTVVPFKLSPTYGYNYFPVVEDLSSSVAALFGVFVLVAILCGFIWKRIRTHTVYIGMVLFSVCIFFYTHLLQVTADIFAERWAYLPSVGIAIGLGWLLQALYQRWRIVTGVLVSLLFVYYVALIIPYNMIWHDDETLGAAMVKIAPGSIRSHVFVSTVALNHGNYELANQSAQYVTRTVPEYDSGWDILARIKYATADYKGAQRALEKALAINPRYGPARINYARMSYQLEEYELAVQAFETFFSQGQKPYGETEVSMYMLSLIKLGNFAQAIDVLEQYFPEGRNYPKTQFALSLAYFKMGNLEEVQKLLQSSHQSEQKVLEVLAAFSVATGSSRTK